MSNKKLYMGYDEETESLADVTEEVEEEIAEVNESEEVEKEVTEEADSTVVGYVSGCLKLNIREEGYPGANVVCVVPEKTALLIEVAESNDEWYKVYTEAGMEGFCMKQYVTLSE
nr:MAG TPA: putative dipeptidyl-peptidase VI [Caudoviricetes sp.]